MRLRDFPVCLLAAVMALLVLMAPSAQVASATAPIDTAPPPTVNPFLPEDRSISDCISAVPKPGCGSEERGGWHQYLVAIALAGGLTIVGWRIVAGARRAPRPPGPASHV